MITNSQVKQIQNIILKEKDLPYNPWDIVYYVCDSGKQILSWIYIWQHITIDDIHAIRKNMYQTKEARTSLIVSLNNWCPKYLLPSNVIAVSDTCKIKKMQDATKKYEQALTYRQTVYDSIYSYEQIIKNSEKINLPVDKSRINELKELKRQAKSLDNISLKDYL